MGKTTFVVLAASAEFAAKCARHTAYDPSMQMLGSCFTIEDALHNVRQRGAEALVVDVRVVGPSMAQLEVRVAQMPSVALLLLCPRNEVPIYQRSKVASDAIAIPEGDSGLMWQSFAKDLSYRLQLAVATRMRRTTMRAYAWQPGKPFSTRFRGLIAIGASAGGTEAIQEVLRKLPPNIPGMLIVQHMPPVFTKTYAQRLDGMCAMKVREASDGEIILAGNALVAPGGLQCRIGVSMQGQPYAQCRGQDKVSGHCPSVDAMFSSVAQVMGSAAIGIILTGMGKDGAKGLLQMRREGCPTIGQDEKTSMVYGMPAAAYENGAVQRQLPLNEIPLALCSMLLTM